jgi:hypothetical protein
MIFISTSHADTECHPLSGRGVGRSAGPNLENKKQKTKTQQKIFFPSLSQLILVMNYNAQIAFKRGLISSMTSPSVARALSRCTIKACGSLTGASAGSIECDAQV